MKDGFLNKNTLEYSVSSIFYGGGNLYGLKRIISINFIPLGRYRGNNENK